MVTVLKALESDLMIDMSVDKGLAFYAYRLYGEKTVDWVLE